MTILELRGKIEEVKGEIEVASALTATNYEEFNEIRLKQDVATARLNSYQVMLNAFTMQKSIDIMIAQDNPEQSL